MTASELAFVYGVAGALAAAYVRRRGAGAWDVVLTALAWPLYLPVAVGSRDGPERAPGPRDGPRAASVRLPSREEVEAIVARLDRVSALSDELAEKVGLATDDAAALALRWLHADATRERDELRSLLARVRAAEEMVRLSTPDPRFGPVEREALAVRLDAIEASLEADFPIIPLPRPRRLRRPCERPSSPSSRCPPS